MKTHKATPIHSYIIFLFVVWSLVIAGLANWKHTHSQQVTQELAENQARANFNKDKAFRFWMTRHGRIYIPVGEHYQPDPFLAHIKDRDITTPSGIQLSMINPARVVREMDEEFSHLYGVAGRVTSLQPINPGNIPDAWEKTALLQLEKGVKEIFEYTSINGEPYLRLIQPLPIQKGCILCHSDLAEKTNGVGGGVTIALPMKDLLARQDIESMNDARLFVIAWLIGALGLIITFFHLKQQLREKEKVMHALASSQSRKSAILSSALDCIISIDANSRVTEVNPATEETFGYKSSEMIGFDLAELIIPPELREKHKAGMKRLLETGETRILNSRIEITALHADGHQFPIELSITQIDDENETFFTAYLRDLTQAHLLRDKLTHQASHDALTGLMNRRAFEDHVKYVFSEINENTEHCMLYLDLDQFKVVNDSCGHVAGDELLRQVSKMLVKEKRASDTLARLGGDEFGLLLEGCPLDKAKEVASELIENFQQYHFYWEDKVFTVGVSIGIVPVEGRFIDFSELLSAADAACYKAKEDGRNRFHVYKHDDIELSKRLGEMTWVSRIQEALKEDRLVLYKQAITPIGNTGENDALHCEILLRMKDRDGNIIGPDMFIPAAERYNLMLSLDKWVINKTFFWLSQLGNKLDQINLCSINLSGNSITDNSLAAYIHDKLQEYDVPAEIICFEITETAAITNLVKATAFLDELHELGYKFALDDFGSGLSSYGYLKNLPVDFLKIDGEFVRDITTNLINLAMVKSINEIGHIMGKKTIAEYVEDQQTVDMLRHIGVDYAQGYYFSQPKPLQYE
ncbi:MAG: EAL domain-containing protein [Gammaproteobacteria bacterium]|nr:EAL domain-containing protein [Gammaproteobacteria bacterium]